MKIVNIDSLQSEADILVFKSKKERGRMAIIHTVPLIEIENDYEWYVGPRMSGAIEHMTESIFNINGFNIIKDSLLKYHTRTVYWKRTIGLDYPIDAEIDSMSKKQVKCFFEQYKLVHIGPNRLAPPDKWLLSPSMTILEKEENYNLMNYVRFLSPNAENSVFIKLINECFDIAE
jgi:hypothetical protein